MKKNEKLVVKEAWRRIESVSNRKLDPDSLAVIGGWLLDGACVVIWHCAKCKKLHIRPVLQK